MPKTEPTNAKTLLIFTGGTIGASLHENVIDVDSSNSLLLHLYQREYKQDISAITTCNLYSILSENLDTNHIQTLIQTITLHVNKPEIEGIIITHGSDTLAYMAAVLALYFHDAPIPILLVCSDKVLSEPDANGLIHLHVALKFIEQNIAKGVFVPYQNPLEPCYIHLGDKISQSFQLSSRFESLNNNPFMRYENETFVVLNPPHKEPLGKSKGVVRQPPHIIHPYPGMDYTHLALQNGSIILHSTYHSGTLPQSVDILLKRCQQESIRLYFCGIHKRAHHYKSTQALIDAGANILYDTSLEVAFGKIVLGLV